MELLVVGEVAEVGVGACEEATPVINDREGVPFLLGSLAPPGLVGRRDGRARCLLSPDGGSGQPIPESGGPQLDRAGLAVSQLWAVKRSDQSRPLLLQRQTARRIKLE